MAANENAFDELQSLLAQQGVAATLDRLAAQLRAGKRYHELFEALKMATRHRLGLSLVHSESDDLDEKQRTALEDGLIEACREVGLALLRDGQVRAGWMYLRPVGDKKAAAEVLAGIEVDEDNLEQIIEVALHEGVDVARGYRLVLENYGTCNAITTFESALHNKSRADQQAAAQLLLRHLHHELLNSVQGDIARQEGSRPSETTLRELIADREWLFAENSYHVDTTHLSSTVRIARLLSDADSLRLAIDLTDYGRRLNTQFQYHGDEPFADMYPSHALYFRALLGEAADEAAAYFRDKATSLDLEQVGTIAIEIYIDLLARLGRYDEATAAAISLMPERSQPLGIAPSLLELCDKSGHYAPLVDYCRRRDDLLGFTTGICKANQT